MFLASRNLFQNTGRFILSALGVGLALMLVVLLNGLLAGTRQQVTVYLDHTPGKVVVMQAGVNSLAAASSLLPQGSVDAAQQIPGVTKVIPILSQTAFFELHGKKIFTYLIGYDPALGGGPWQLAAGRKPKEGREAVVDQTLARIHEIKIGDEIEVGGNLFPVVGLSEGTNGWMTTLVFIRKTELESLMLVPDLSSFLLVESSAELSNVELRNRLAELPGTETWLKSEINSNDLKLYAAIFKPMQIMSIIAFLVGTLVVGLVTYTSTLERQREFGVLKAIGASKRRLYTLVLQQTLILALVGSLLGVGLAWVAAQVIMIWRNQFLVVLEPQMFGVALLAGLVMAFFAALVPVRLVANLAPADVFRR